MRLLMPPRRKLLPVKGMMNASCLWQLAAGASVVNANGNSGQINVSSWENFILMASVGAPSGSSPTLAVHVDGYDNFGNVYTDLCSAADPVLNFTGGSAQNLQSTLGLSAQFVVSTSAGTPGPFNQLFCAPVFIAVRWVIGGTGSPSFPSVYMSLFGR